MSSPGKGSGRSCLRDREAARRLDARGGRGTAAGAGPIMGGHSWTLRMMERIREASPRLKARITGVVYLAYFLTAIFAEVAVGEGRHVAYVGVNLVAYAFYIAVTLLFYFMFKPVNRGLSLLAAFFSLAGCANELLGDR